MAVSFAFGSGTLTYGGTSIDVQNVTYEETAEVIELYTNKNFPVAAAVGKKSVKGTFSVGGVESTLLASIENATMAPQASATTLAWSLPLQGGGSASFTVANVVLGSKKLSASNDGFATMEVSWTGFAELAGDTVVTVA